VMVIGCLSFDVNEAVVVKCLSDLLEIGESHKLEFWETLQVRPV
jgi:hypothetical protein